jgi:hypothetical protein
LLKMPRLFIFGLQPENKIEKNYYFFKSQSTKINHFKTSNDTALKQLPLLRFS